MNPLLPIFIIFIAIAIAVIFYFWISKFDDPDNNSNSSDTDNSDKHTKAKFITNRELSMFNVLRKALPDEYIFIQVSFSALLNNNSMSKRNKFNRLRTDYVIADKNFKVLAVVEIDDKSHIGKEKSDARRDAILREAGYKVLRYQQIPSENVIKNDVYTSSAN